MVLKNKRSALKLFNLALIILMLLTFFGCNNPNGGSVLTNAHAPLLKPPGEFNFTSVQVISQTASLNWDAAARTSEYRIFYGFSLNAISNELLSCRGLNRSCSLNELEKGVSYFFKVVAYNLGGSTTISSIRHVRIIAPFNLSSLTTGTEANQLIVTFPQDTIGAENYVVRYGTDPTNLNQSITTTTSPAIIPNIIGGDLYYVVVEASNTIGDGISVISTNKLSETPLVQLFPPSTVIPFAEPGKVNLSWTIAPGAKWYVILRKINGVGSYQQIATNVKTLNYLDSTVTNGETYQYVVIASNGAESEESSSVVVKPIGAFVLTSATSITSTGSGVSWGPAAGGDNYDVYLKINGGAYSKLSSQTSRNFTFTNLLPGTTYITKIIATNNVTTPVTTSSSNEVTFTTAPLAVSNLVANSSASGVVDLSWTAPASTTPLSYIIKRGTSSGSFPVTLATSHATTTFIDSTVSDGVDYFYIVIANNGTPSGPSLEVAKRPISSCAITSSSALDKTSLTLNWSTCLGSDFYEVIVSTTSGNTTSIAATLAAPVNTYTATGLTDSTNYYLKIRARNSLGTGVSRLSSEVQQVTYPKSPTISVLAGLEQATVSWTAIPTVNSYRVFRGTQSGIYDTEFTTSSTSRVDTGLVSGQAYYYVVRSNNGYESVDSTEIGVKPIANFSISSTTVTSSSITVNWPNVAGAESYNIQYRKGADSFSPISNQPSGSSIPSLLAGTSYEVKVGAQNSVGANQTLLTSPTITVKTTPISPTLSSISSTNGSITFSWSAVTGAEQYRIYRTTTSGNYSFSTPYTTVTSTTFTDSAVTAGVEYFYVISAFNGTESSISNQVSASAVGAISAPVLTALSSSSLKIDWTAPTGASSYKVFYKLASNPIYEDPITTTETTLTLTGLNSGLSYEVYVKAINSIGTSGASFTSPTATKATLPSTITDLSVASLEALKVNLTWSPVVGATKYHVYRGTGPGSLSLLSVINGQSSSTHLDTGLTGGTVYYYSVRPHNGSVEVGDSNIESIKVIGSFSLTSLAAASSTSVNLNWTSALGADGYDVNYGLTELLLFNLQDIGVAASTSYTLTELSPSTLYYIKLKAKNSEGTNIFTVMSLPLTVTTSPSAPVLSAVAVSSGTVSFQVAHTSGATNYNVYRSESSGGPYSQVASAKTSTTFTDTNATNGKTWFYVVRSFNGTESTDSNEVSAQPLPSIAISSIQDLSGTSIRLTWNFSETINTDNIAYELKWGTSAGNLNQTITPLSSSSYDLEGLSVDSTYYFQVTATTTAGPAMTVSSSVVSGITNNPPGMSTLFDEGSPSNEMKNIPVTISDSNDLLSCSSLSVSSSNESVVSSGGLAITGIGPICNLMITPEGNPGTTSINLSLTDGKDITTTSFNFIVASCQVDYIGWVTQPSSLNAGANWSGPLKVVLKSKGPSGPICDDDESAVYLSVAKDPSVQQDALVTGVSKTIPVGGYAEFSSAGMTRAGTGFTIVATQGDLVSEENSSPFNVNAASGTASQLIWGQMPVSFKFDQGFRTAPVLHSADQYGNYIAPLEELEIEVNLYKEDGTFVMALDNNPFTTLMGMLSFDNFSVSETGAYYLRASSSLGVINSDVFMASAINQENTIALLEMLQGPIFHNKTYPVIYPRSSLVLGKDSLDGTNVYKWRLVATHSDSAAATVVLREGGVVKGTFNLTPNSSNPTVYEMTISAPSLSRGKWSLSVSGQATVFSSKLIIEQKLATRSLTYIPLTSLPNAGADYIRITHTALENPDVLNFPTFSYNWSNLSSLEGAQLLLVSKTSDSNVCARLFSKTNNIPIGNEVCSSAGGETLTTLDISASDLPTAMDEIEIRTRSTSGEGHIYKIGLLLKYHGIQGFLSVQRLSPQSNALSSSISFEAQKGISLNGTRDEVALINGSDYSTETVNEEIFCQTKVVSASQGEIKLFTQPSTLLATISLPSSSGTYDIFNEFQSHYPLGQYLTFSTSNASSVYHLAHCLMLTKSIGYQ